MLDWKIYDIIYINYIIEISVAVLINHAYLVHFITKQCVKSERDMHGY